MTFQHAIGPVLLAIVLGPVAPAVAQEISSVPEHLLGMVGDWRLEQEDQTLPTCGLVFTEDQTAAGWAVTLPEPCPVPFPSGEAMASWNIDDTDGSVLLLDASSGITLRLFESEDGFYVTGDGIVPAIYLMPPWDDEGTGGETGEDLGE